MDTADKVKITKSAIEQQFNAIARIQKNIDTAGNYEDSKKLLDEKHRLEFELARAQRELTDLEKQQADEQNQAAIAKYDLKVKEYSTKLNELEGLEKDLHDLMTKLDNQFSAHFGMCKELKMVHKELQDEANTLGVKGPDPVPYGDQNADRSMNDLVERADSLGYVSRLLQLPYDNYHRGPWVQTMVLPKPW